jgi:GNAT superfamily N-acetyltransferase
MFMPQAWNLFAALAQENLVLESIKEGVSSGKLLADSEGQPGSVFAWYGVRAFLAGSPDQTDFNQALAEYLRQELIAHLPQDGEGVLLMHNAAPAWKEHYPEIFPDLRILTYPQRYLECTRLVADWRALMPEGFRLLPVDADLLAQDNLANMDYLRAETCSERNSMEDFLAHSFGFALLWGDELAAWCLSEYNCASRCEVGVATVEKYQRRGLATIVSLALVEYALAHGITRIGWHCWARNDASVALALKSGFLSVSAHDVDIVILKEKE